MGWDLFTSKGVIHFQIEHNGETLDFFNTHMQQSYKKLEQKARLYQSLQLANFVNSKLESNPSKNVWIIGDSNMWSYTKYGSSVHSKNRDDYYFRGASYDMLLKLTETIDIEKSFGNIYFVLTKNPQNGRVQNISSNGLTAGEYLVITINV